LNHILEKQILYENHLWDKIKKSALCWLMSWLHTNIFANFLAWHLQIFTSLLFKYITLNCIDNSCHLYRIKCLVFLNCILKWNFSRILKNRGNSWYWKRMICHRLVFWGKSVFSMCTTKFQMITVGTACWHIRGI
jgi:hypothetical protein